MILLNIINNLNKNNLFITYNSLSTDSVVEATVLN